MSHKLRISTLGTQVTREWYRLSDGLVETDAAIIAQLEAGLAGCRVVTTQESCFGDGTGVAIPVYRFVYADSGMSEWMNATNDTPIDATFVMVDCCSGETI